MLQCSAVTPPSITRRVFSRQGSLFYPSVNQHPQADSPGSSCQTTQHLPPHCFAAKCLAFTWLCAPHPSRLSRIKQEASCTSVQHRGIAPLHYLVRFRALPLKYKSTVACKQNRTHKHPWHETCRGLEIKTNHFIALINLAKYDGLVCGIYYNLPPLVFTRRKMKGMRQEIAVNE